MGIVLDEVGLEHDPLARKGQVEEPQPAQHDLDEAAVVGAGGQDGHARARRLPHGAPLPSRSTRAAVHGGGRAGRQRAAEEGAAT